MLGTSNDTYFTVNSVSIDDLLGKNRLFFNSDEINNTDGVFEIDTKFLEPGVYFLSITTTEKIFHKIIIKK